MVSWISSQGAGAHSVHRNRRDCTRYSAAHSAGVRANRWAAWCCVMSAATAFPRRGGNRKIEEPGTCDGTATRRTKARRIAEIDRRRVKPGDCNPRASRSQSRHAAVEFLVSRHQQHEINLAARRPARFAHATSSSAHRRRLQAYAAAGRIRGTSSAIEISAEESSSDSFDAAAIDRL